jgi:N-acetylglucosaminyldiphosphoundecaprenol N-acetyl-beta-D-mannosaminyltransferase
VIQNEQLANSALTPMATAAALPDFDRDVYCILGLPFDRVSLAEASRKMRTASTTQQRCFLSTPNLNFAIACMSDAAFRNSVIQSDLSIADGMPLIWIARAIGLPVRERVAGSSVFQTLRERQEKTDSAAVDGPMKVYFFGGPPGVAEAASLKLNAIPSAMRCVGFDSPGFGSIEEMSDAATIARINASDADFLVVALGAKKGQAWIQYNLARLRAPLVSHLGAVVNFVAGTVSRAPVWAQKTGLEWLWRIKEEPKLWRRYWDDGVALLQLMVTRVIPCVLASRRQAPPASDFTPAGIIGRHQDGAYVLAFPAALGEANSAPLRVALRTAALAAEPLILDCSKTHFIDSAALASLMLLYGDSVAKGRSLKFTQVSPVLRRQFYLHCADYLLESR